MASKPSAPHMTVRGLLCILIGAAVLITPMVIAPSNTREMLVGAQLVGWFALVLGAALVLVDVLKRRRP